MTEKLEMPVEQFAEAVSKENARLRAALEKIADLNNKRDRWSNEIDIVIQDALGNK
jgi:hypothetical protein